MRSMARDESGTTLVLLMLVLVVLLGLSAIALDGAAAWAQRRQNQSAADTGALAGSILIGTKPSTIAVADATSEVIRITYETIEPDLSFAEWVAAWTACTDPKRPPEYTITDASACVSFTDDLTRIRVHVPTIEVPTTFGKILGRDSISTDATAEAGTQPTFGGGVLPFGLPGAVASTVEVCLKTGSNPQGVPPCDGSDTGNFAFLDITHFGSITLGTTTECTGGTTGRMVRNIVEGVDHFLGAADSADGVPVVDRDVCGDGDFAVEPSTITTETGNMTGVLHDGLVVGAGGTGLPGRLTRGSNTREVGGVSVDDTPLWEFLSADGLAFCGSPANREEMVACLASWEPADGIIFISDIAESPRWAWVPLFWENDLGNGNSNRTIREFRPVYIQTTLWDCNANSCRIVFDPGETIGGTGAGSGSAQIEAISGIQIPIDALPFAIQDGRPGTDGAKEYSLIE